MERVAQSASQVSCKASDICIVPAIKRQQDDIVEMLAELGISNVGENRVQEMMSKYNSELPMNWHFIGRLQTNKVRYIIDKVSLFHSLDRISLVDKLSSEAAKCNISANALIEVNIAEELSKGGVSPKDTLSFVLECERFENINLLGFMSVMPHLENTDKLEYHYKKIYELYMEIGNMKGLSFKHLSVGMSDDFELAIKCGANMIRPGRILFGERN